MPTACFPDFQNLAFFNNGRSLSAISSHWSSDNADRNFDSALRDAANNLWYLSFLSSSVVVLITKQL